MKFTEFRRLVEEYKNLISKNENEKADDILHKLDPNGLGLKRFFVIKKFRVEKVIEHFCETNNLNLHYALENVTNKYYDFIIKIEDEEFRIKCRTKKSVGYVHLKCLYENVIDLNGVDALIKKYPEIVDALWKTVLATNNEIKCRKITSLSMQIANNEKQLEYTNKECSMIAQLISQLSEERDSVKSTLDEINIESIEDKGV